MGTDEFDLRFVVIDPELLGLRIRRQRGRDGEGTGHGSQTEQNLPPVQCLGSFGSEQTVGQALDDFFQHGVSFSATFRPSVGSVGRSATDVNQSSARKRDGKYSAVI